MAKEFTIVETYDYEDFCKEVNVKLNEGWELHGNLIAFPNFTDEDGVQSVRYIQAMVKASQQTRTQQFI